MAQKQSGRESWLSWPVLRPVAAGAAVALLGAAVLAAGIGGCAAKEQKPPKKPVTVQAAKVDIRDEPVEIRTFGNIEAYNTVAVKAQVGGQLTIVHIKEGQDVKKDQVILTIDPRPFEAALNVAKANLARDTVQEKNAELIAKRSQALLEQKIASQEETDQSKANAEALAAAITADQAAIDMAKLSLEYCTIRSPVDGRVGSLLLDQGNQIKANDVPIVIINQIQPIYVTFTVPENRLPEIRRNNASGELKVTAAVQGDDQHAEQGVLTFIDNAVDMTTGTIRLKATFKNADQRLWPGQYANVLLTLAVEKNVMAVPSQAVQTGQDGRYVIVVKPNMTVEFRNVTLERMRDNDAVISKGLQAGESVVTDGMMMLAADSTVVVSAVAPSAAAPAQTAGATPATPAEAADPAPAGGSAATVGAGATK